MMDTPKKILSDRYIDMDWDESLALNLNLKQCRHVIDLDNNRTFNIWITESDTTIELDTSSTCSTDECSGVTGNETVEASRF